MSFVKTDIVREIEKILDSDIFFPIMVSGPTGCGKTFPIISLCVEKSRSIIPINITHLTDENTLIGSIRIKEGTTYFEEGPVVRAMKEGAVLLLDELDLALPENIMCLQTIIDGSGYYIKQTGEMVEPQKGFTVIATCNTKGLGDDSGSYIGTNILNEAFLERFIINFEVDYMDKNDEISVLKNLVSESNITVRRDWIELLVKWANQIRETVKKSNDFSHNISTRRLVHIIKTYGIYNDEIVSVNKCLNRFDTYHKESFYNIYELLDKGRIKNSDSELLDHIEKEYGKQFNKIRL